MHFSCYLRFRDFQELQLQLPCPSSSVNSSHGEFLDLSVHGSILILYPYNLVNNSAPQHYILFTFPFLVQITGDYKSLTIKFIQSLLLGLHYLE